MDTREKEFFDIIVAGAGPAGSHTARLLAGMGYSVLLLDRTRFPRVKPCGGGLPVKTLKAIGLDLSPVIERRIEGTLLTCTNSHPVALEAKGIGAMVCRERLDAFLVEKAMEAGARFLEGCRLLDVALAEAGCTVETERGSFSCRVLVGADGAKGVVSAKSGLKGERGLATAVERRVVVNEDVLEALGETAVMDYGVVPWGYAWVFPKGDHLSVGAYTTLPRPADLEARLDRFMAGNRYLEGSKILSTHWHPIPLGGGRRPLHRGRTLLVGDAAGLADPFFGEGIVYAVRSAAIAARRIDGLLGGHTKDLSGYSEEVYQDLAADLRYGRLLRRLFYLNPARSHGVLAKNGYLGRWFAALIRGDLSYRGLLLKALLTLPFWIWACRGGNENQG